MKRLLKFLLASFLILLAAAIVVPLLIPVPPLPGTRPPRELADPDSRFIEIDGIDIHYKELGTGEPALILLHGFAASVFSWREVMAPLAARGYRVIAFDRPAFGLTERPLEWQGENPYSAAYQAQLTVRLMDALGVKRAILAGNSAGGAIAALTTLEYPTRVQALILVDAAIYRGGRRSPLAWLGMTPQMQRLGPLLVRNIGDWGLDFARSAWHDPSKITDEIWAGYTQPLQAQNWDRGLYYLTIASRDLKLHRRLAELTLPTLVISGDDDRIVPTAESVRLASELPDADLVVIPACGHAPQEECPDDFIAAVETFLAGLSTR